MLLAYSASYAQSNLNFSIETKNEDSYAVLSGYTPETETELTIPNKVTIEDKEYEVKLQVLMAIARIEGGEEAKGSVWKQMSEARK